MPHGWYRVLESLAGLQSQGGEREEGESAFKQL